MKPGIDLGGGGGGSNGGGGGGGGEDEENSSLEDSNSLNLLDGLDENDVGEESEEGGSSFRSSLPLGHPSASAKRKLKYNYSNRKRKCRTTFTKIQLSVLEAEFCKSNFVSNDKIDSIVEQTGLDSRIIKNWFKNKRSRVLADSKQPSINGSGALKRRNTVKVTQPAAQLATNLAKVASNPLESTAPLDPTHSPKLGSNTNGLQISTESPRPALLMPSAVPEMVQMTHGVQQRPQAPRINHGLSGLLDIVNSIKSDLRVNHVNVVPMMRPSQAIVSKPAAPSECPNCVKNSSCMCTISRLALSRLYRNFLPFNAIERHYGDASDAVGYQVIRRAVCHPTKQWAEQHRDFYSFFDPHETEKVFFVL